MKDVILDFLRKEKKAFSLNSLESRLGIKKSLIHGCLVHLEASGLIFSFRFQKIKYYAIKEI